VGIIQKQSIQGSILLYIGVFLGFVTTAILFPRILEPEQIGLLNTLLSYSIVFAQFALLGFNSVIIRNFSYFRNYTNKHNHFFFLILLVMVTGGGLSVAVYYLIKPFIISQNIENAPLFVAYIDYLVPLMVFTLMFFILDSYYTVLFKTVRGIVLKEVVQRVFILIALYLYYFRYYDFNHFTLGYIVSLSIPGLVLFFLIVAEGEWTIRPKFDFISKDMARSMFSVGLFGVLTSLVGNANMQIDRAMASSMISLEATGIYSTVFIFASLIKVPSRAMLKIASAFIADAWKNSDKPEIIKIYRSTCLNQFIVAQLVLVIIWCNLDHIFTLLPEQYGIGRQAIIWLSIAFTLEMASGASSTVIATSKNYKMLTWMVFAALIIMVVSNLVFIPAYQITGVAIATSITTIFLVAYRVFYIMYKYGMQPYDIRFLYLIGIGAASYFLQRLLPTFEPFFIDIILRSILIAAGYGTMVLVFKISTSINEKILDLFKMVFKTK
jgi:O-antigen/teichoic acid export membrane protein